jgi:hypothetical protein
VAFAAFACLASLPVGWVGVRGVRAIDHLRAAAQLFGHLQQQLAHGENGDARTTLDALQSQTRAARAETADPGWRLAGHLPFAGSDLAALRTVTVALDDLAQHGLPPLLESTASIAHGDLVPANGRTDIATVRAVASRMVTAAAAVVAARDRVAAIRTDDLVPQLREKVAELQDSLDRAAAVSRSAARVGQLLPAMLGADGPRSYLVLFQNLAEARATGGMPGAYLVIRADRGAIEIVDQGSASSGMHVHADRPVLRLDPDMRALYTDRMGRYPADVNLTPHFPTAAALAREMYRRRTGNTVDGVLATDPVALSYLLKALGPVAMPSGTLLTADNAVQTLLSGVYSSVPSAAQDGYFAAAARGVFEALTRQPHDVAAMIAQLSRAAGERRILMWSADPGQQKVIEGTMLEGALPITDRTRPTVGVFLNDGTAAKMSYYLTYAADLSVADGCRPDGSRELHLRVTLRSTAPSSGLSKDVLGLGLAGEPYTIRTNISMFSSTGGAVRDAYLDGSQQSLVLGMERRRSVAIVTVDLKPGETRTVEAILLTGKPPAGAGPTLSPRLWTSPGVRPWALNVHSASICPIAR